MAKLAASEAATFCSHQVRNEIAVDDCKYVQFWIIDTVFPLVKLSECVNVEFLLSFSMTCRKRAGLCKLNA